MKLNAQNLKRRFAIGGITILAIALLALSYYLFGTFSEGNRVGTIVKISKKGVFFKTWEGQLNLNAAVSTPQQNNKNAAVLSTVWEFSVNGSETAVLYAIDSAATYNHRVKLHYQQKFITLPWRGDTEYMVYKVEILK